MPSSVKSVSSTKTPRTTTKSPVQKDPMEEIYKDPKKYQEFYNELFDKLDTEKRGFDECSFVFLNTKRPLEPIISLQTSTEELFYGSYDGPIRCFSTTNGKRTQTLRGHNSLISSLELVPRATVSTILGLEEDDIEEEQTEDEKELKSRNELVLFSGSRDGDIRCWDLKSSKCAKKMSSPNGAPITSMKVCLRNNDRPFCASGALNGDVSLWDLEKGVISTVYTGHASNVSSIDYADTKLFSSSFDSFVKIVDVEKEEIVSVLRPNQQPIRSISVSGNDLFVGTSTGVIYQYDLRNGQVTGSFKGHADSVLCTRIYDANYLLSGSEDSFVVLWDIKTKEMVHVYGGHKDCVTAISITDQDKSVYSGSLDKTIRRWGANSAIQLVQKERELIEHKKRLEELLAKSRKPAANTR